MGRRAKIVSTIGPASRSREALRSLIEAGTDVVRLNMSHGTRQEHADVVASVRHIAAELKKPVAILLDLAGPKLRTGTLKGKGPVNLPTGASITITAIDIEGDETTISTNYPQLPREVSVGDRILLDDGLIELVVEEKKETEISCRIVHGGRLGERKGLNLPGVTLSVSALTEKDQADLKFGLEQGVDYIGLSFVRSADDCLMARRLIEQSGYAVPIIAKIEKREAVKSLDEIIRVADGVMVARGDLGVETSVESVPVIQKEIIAKANRAEKVVITATQMLQSMIENPRPTRAEASDVANAILDGTDAVMLSGETAVGEFPIEAVKTMNRIVCTAEESPLVRHILVERAGGEHSGSYGRAIAEAAAFAAEEMNARLIVVFSEGGNMPRHLAALRPSQRIIALTPSAATYRRLALVWGVEPHQCEFSLRSDELITSCDHKLMSEGIASRDEVVVLMAGRLSGLGLSSMMKLHRVGEELS
jgi:pyruvate kinase